MRFTLLTVPMIGGVMLPAMPRVLADGIPPGWQVILTLIGGTSILGNLLQWLDKRTERKTQAEQGEIGRLWTWCREQEKEISDIRVEMTKMRDSLDELTKENNALKLENTILKGQLTAVTNERNKAVRTATAWKERAEELETKLQVHQHADIHADGSVGEVVSPSDANEGETRKGAKHRN